MSALRVCPDSRLLTREAAYFVQAAYEAALNARGRFTIALAGGSTPRELYRLLATEEFASRVDWQRVRVGWGDERCVPPDHHDSNFHMAREALLDHVPIPMSNIHRIQGELEPEQAAADYARKLRDSFGGRDGPTSRPPRFDLVLLGLGTDGHTASLFPGSEALDEAEHWTAVTYVRELRSWRVTLTLPVLNAAEQVMFLVSGSSKAEPLRAVLHPADGAEPLPAARVQPASGRLHWFVDREAAALLD